MIQKVLYDGEFVKEGHFSRVDFINLMEFIIGEKILRDEPPYIEAESATDRIDEEYVWHMEGGIKINYMTIDGTVNPEEEPKGRTCASILGPKKEVIEIEKKILETMRNCDYNPD